MRWRFEMRLWNFEFPFFNDFVIENFKFIIVPNGETKTPLIRKMSHRRAKGIEICDSLVDSLVVLLHNIRHLWPCSIQCNLELFGAHPIFLKILCPKKTHYFFYTNRTCNLSNFFWIIFSMITQWFHKTTFLSLRLFLLFLVFLLNISNS